MKTNSPKPKIRLEKRAGKAVTVIAGLHTYGAKRLDMIAGELKSTFATGGTVKNGAIEIHGDKVALVKNWFIEYLKIAVFVAIVGESSLLYAADEKAKGLEVVTDTATAVVNKTTALLTGNLECTMTTGKDKYRKDYTFDPQGRRIPRATLGRYDSGVR